MNILYHHRTQGHGAEGVHISAIVRGFRKRGHNVVLCSPPGIHPFQNEGGYVYGDGVSPTARLWKALSRHAPQIIFEIMEIAYNLVRRRALARIIDAGRFDFIYERHAFFLWVTASLARRRKIPFLLEVNEVTGIPRARPLLLRPLAAWIEKWVLSRASLIFTVSSYLKERITSLGVDPGKVIVLPNGVDEKMFSPAQDGSDVRAAHGLVGKQVVGFVGWIDPWDNLPGLLEAFGELASGRPDLRLLLVGDVAGKGVRRDFVAEHVERLKLDGRVVHLPCVPREQMPRHIAAMDVCVIPDSNPFGSPVVLFEFMASGKAVAAPSVAPVEDVVVSGINGIVFKNGDGAALRESLRRIIEDKPLRERLGRSARESVEREHTWGHKAGAVLAGFAGLPQKGDRP